MFKKLKDFAIKKAIQSQLKKVPKEQAEMLELILEKNPDLLMKIAQEAQDLIKGGKDQMSAMMEVMRKYAPELQKTIGKMPRAPRPF